MISEYTLRGFYDEMAKIAAISSASAKRRANYLFSPRASKERWRTVPRNAASEDYVTAIEASDKADDKLKKHVRSMFLLSHGRTVAKVPSSKGGGKTYEVKDLGNGEYGCTCPDWRYRGSVTPGYECKHIRGVKAGKSKAASFSEATIRELSSADKKRRLRKMDKEQNGYMRSGRPFSTLLTQDEEPTDYYPANPANEEPDVILGHNNGA